MKNSKSLFDELIRLVAIDQEREEVESLIRALLEDLFGVTRTMILTNEEIAWDDTRQDQLDQAVSRINKAEPVQYVVRSASFFGRRFFVDQSVLIPRPETEELVAYVLDFVRTSSPKEDLRILDIGTGSGCIPVTIAAEVPSASVMATEISEQAIAVARKNIVDHKVGVQLLLHDVLSSAVPFRELDVIVSNPPYIPLRESTAMSVNVVGFEPHLALFVPDDDPLLFYKAIIGQATTCLRDGGALFVETHHRHCHEVADLFSQHGFRSDTMKDMSGNDRIVKATRL